MPQRFALNYWMVTFKRAGEIVESAHPKRPSTNRSTFRYYLQCLTTGGVLVDTRTDKDKAFMATLKPRQYKVRSKAVTYNRKVLRYRKLKKRNVEILKFQRSLLQRLEKTSKEHSTNVLIMQEINKKPQTKATLHERRKTKPRKAKAPRSYRIPEWLAHHVRKDADNHKEAGPAH